VKCLVEILAPNQRPYQTTSDMESFWRNGYLQMKKDLAGRYPRHDWPNEAP
jgi:ATP-dependent helicase HrpB